MNQEKGRNVNMLANIPRPFKTDTEKIAWLGDKIRSCLLTIEKESLLIEKAKEDIELYGRTIKSISKKGGEKDEQS